MSRPSKSTQLTVDGAVAGCVAGCVVWPRAATTNMGSASKPQSQQKHRHIRAASVFLWHGFSTRVSTRVENPCHDKSQLHELHCRLGPGLCGQLYFCERLAHLLANRLRVVHPTATEQFEIHVA